jgi:hypothetical protein
LDVILPGKLEKQTLEIAGNQNVHEGDMVV